MKIKSFKDLPKEYIELIFTDPVFFAKVVFGNYLWSKQREVARALVKYKKVAVYSATGTGKSFLAANLIPFFLQTKINSIIPVVGSNYRQTLRTLWRPLISQFYKARIKLLGEPDTSKWCINKGMWYAEVLSMRRIESLQGLHAETSFFLIEEASGVPSEVFDAIDGNMTGGDAYVLQIGNPLRPYGEFYDTLFDPEFYKVRISIFDTPNFTGEDVPEQLKRLLPNEDYVRRAETKYGKDSAFWKAKVLGQFPKEDDFGLFDINLVEKSMEQWKSKREFYLQNINKFKRYLTVDVARGGGDEIVISDWIDKFQCELNVFKNSDTVELTNIIINMCKEKGVDYIILDGTGLGIGVYDNLKNAEELDKAEVYCVIASENAFDEKQYADSVTEGAFLFKDELKNNSVYLYPDDEMKKQFTAMSYTFDKRGRFRMLQGRELKSKLKFKSPDRAMSVIFRFVVLNQRLGIS